MRVAAESRGAVRSRNSGSLTIPAPIGGLNARDSIANMPPTDALTLINFFPNATSCDRRAGDSTWATFTGLCETAIDYAGLTATKLFVGVSNSGTYSLIEATAGGAISTPVVGGGGATVQALTSVRFDWINVGTSGGQYLLLCNGADPMLEYDGTTWSVGSITGITGGTSAIRSIALFQERVFLMQKDSFNVWYLAVGAKSGAATQLNLGSLFKLGGCLSAMMTVSLDTASALADHICFVSTQGEVVTFKGNVADSTSWTRVSHVRVGRPITYGVRSWVKLSNDAVLICVDGVFPISKAIQTDRADTRYSLSDKIVKLVNEAIALYPTNYGWSVVFHPYGKKLILNVPVASTGASNFQYVMNTDTKAWCRFSNWDAICWLVTGDTLYYGMSGKLAKADVGTSDLVQATPANQFIFGRAKQAFNYFGSRAVLKNFKAMRVNCVWLTGSLADIRQRLNVDFEDVQPANQTDQYRISVATTGGTEVDSVVSNWYGAGGAGRAAAIYIAILGGDTQTLPKMQWLSTDIIYETGGIL